MAAICRPPALAHRPAPPLFDAEQRHQTADLRATHAMQRLRGHLEKSFSHWGAHAAARADAAIWEKLFSSRISGTKCCHEQGGRSGIPEGCGLRLWWDVLARDGHRQVPARQRSRSGECNLRMLGCRTVHLSPLLAPSDHSSAVVAIRSQQGDQWCSLGRCKESSETTAQNWSMLSSYASVSFGLRLRRRMWSPFRRQGPQVHNLSDPFRWNA